MTAARPCDTAVTFRPSAPVDAPAIHAVWVRAVRATHHFLSDTDFDDISAMVRDDYAPHADFLVAERAGVIVGFMGMTGRTIDSLFLDPDMFGPICSVRGSAAPLSPARHRPAPRSPSMSTNGTPAPAPFTNGSALPSSPAPIPTTGTGPIRSCISAGMYKASS